jgi:TPR repeat protein
MRTNDTTPNNWIELYLRIAARGCGHKDAAYRLAIRSRALGQDAEAARWFTLADRSGHRGASERFEMIAQEIWSDVAEEEWP